MIRNFRNNYFVYCKPCTSTIKFPSGVDYAHIIIIGGGGGGIGRQNGGGGGGGAGGFIEGFFKINKELIYTLKVGAGGSNCTNGEDSYIDNIGVAKGGYSNTSIAIKSISTTSVSPGGIGGDSYLYNMKNNVYNGITLTNGVGSAICLKGGDGGDGSPLNLDNVRDGYDYTTSLIPAGGGGGGIGLAQASYARQGAGGSGGGAFGGSSGSSYTSSVPIMSSGGPGGFCFNGGDARGGSAGSSVYGPAYFNRSGFDINYSISSTNGSSSTDVGRGGGSYGSLGSSFTPVFTKNTFLPYNIQYFYNCFNFYCGSNSGMYSTTGSPALVNLGGGGVGGTSQVSGNLGTSAGFCGGGGGSVNNNIGGYGMLGGGGGGRRKRWTRWSWLYNY